MPFERGQKCTSVLAYFCHMDFEDVFGFSLMFQMQSCTFAMRIVSISDSLVHFCHDVSIAVSAAMRPANLMPTRPLWIWTFSFLIFKFLFEIGAIRLNLIKVVCSSCGTRHGSSKPLPVWQLSWTSFAWLCLIYNVYKLAD